jgi:uncharacterized protein YajQ (UPF0234 family)
MPAESSFDIVSQFDRQELKNAVDQADREISQRYDLKSTGTTLELGEDTLTVTTDSDFTLKPAARGTVRQIARLRRGIDQELGREVVKFVKASAPKVRPQIQGDAVRVFGRSKDDLQAALQLVRKKEWPVPIQFVNYR